MEKEFNSLVKISNYLVTNHIRRRKTPGHTGDKGFFRNPLLEFKMIRSVDFIGYNLIFLYNEDCGIIGSLFQL